MLEDRWRLASGLTDSILRESLSAPLTLPASHSKVESRTGNSSKYLPHVTCQRSCGGSKISIGCRRRSAPNLSRD